MADEEVSIQRIATVRMPKALYDAAKEAAHGAKVSLNTFCEEAIALAVRKVSAAAIAPADGPEPMED